MTQAIQISRYLIKLAAQEEEPGSGYLTPLHVQKLLYYVQGWSLALRGTPAFSDDIEAWRYGPVVESVYQAYKKFDDKPIPPGEIPEPDELPEEAKAITASIWE